MNDVKLSDLEQKKPIAVSPDGELLNAGDLERGAESKPLDELSAEQRCALALRRMEMNPDFELRFGRRKYTTQQLVGEIGRGTTLGLELVDAELLFAADLQANLAGLPKKFEVDLPDVIEPAPAIGDRHLWVPEEVRQAMANRVAIFAMLEDAQLRTNTQYKIDHVIPAFTDVGITTHRLPGATLSRDCFANFCKLSDTVYISGLSHGDPDAFWGQDLAKNPLWKVGEYDPAEAANKIIHLRSCYTAAELGIDLVDKGARAFFGYDKHVAFWAPSPLPPWPPDPDRIDLLSICDAIIDVSLACGCDCGTTADCTYWAYCYCIDFARSENGLEAQQLSGLLTNLNGFRNPHDGAWGSPTASLNYSAAAEAVEARQASLASAPPAEPLPSFNLKEVVSGLIGR